MLLLCTDEEGGLYPGIRYLAEQGLLGGHILNFNGSAAPRIWAGCFGMFTLLVRIHGRTVHAGEAARAGAGANAIEAALPMLNALAALKPEIAKRHPALPPRQARRARLPRSSTFPLRMAAQAAARCLPQFEILTLNRRYAPEEDFLAARRGDRGCHPTRRRGPRPSIEIVLIGHLAADVGSDRPALATLAGSAVGRVRLRARRFPQNGAQRAAPTSAGCSGRHAGSPARLALAGRTATFTRPANSRRCTDIVALAKASPRLSRRRFQARSHARCNRHSLIRRSVLPMPSVTRRRISCRDRHRLVDLAQDAPSPDAAQARRHAAHLASTRRRRCSTRC